jgi:hypothetical protein
MAQHKTTHREASVFARFLHLRTKWRIFFWILFSLDALFLLQVLHAVFIYPATQTGVMSVVFVALYGLFIIYTLALLHIFLIAIYLFARRPDDWRLAASLVTVVAAGTLLYVYNFHDFVKGYTEKKTIINETTIPKKTALRLLQECRINDLVITQKYGAKVTFYTLYPDSPNVKTVYVTEEDIQDVQNAVKDKGDDCGREIRIYNDGTVNSVAN